MPLWAHPRREREFDRKPDDVCFCVVGRTEFAHPIVSTFVVDLKRAAKRVMLPRHHDCVPIMDSGSLWRRPPHECDLFCGDKSLRIPERVQSVFERKPREATVDTRAADRRQDVGGIVPPGEHVGVDALEIDVMHARMVRPTTGSAASWAQESTAQIPRSIQGRDSFHRFCDAISRAYKRTEYDCVVLRMPVFWLRFLLGLRCFGHRNGVVELLNQLWCQFFWHTEAARH